MGQKKPTVVVVIPIYQSELSNSELISLRQCMLVLGKYPITVMKPASLKLEAIEEKYPNITYESFDDQYFTGTTSYNQLLISQAFYERFSGFEYMLIYQLDAFVFRDELKKWCKAGYDYVGSPTLHQEQYNAYPASRSKLYAEALKSNRFVLNGGLSLRRIPAFIRYIKIYNFFYSPWLGNEDMLFSQEATRLLPMRMWMRKPAWNEALTFSFEKSPAAAYKITKEKLPFGCHAWEKYDPDFWRTFIPLM